MSKKEHRKHFWRQRFRITIQEESTFHERRAYLLSGRRISSIVIGAVFSVSVISYAIIAYTPLTEFLVPGFIAKQFREDVTMTRKQSDSALATLSIQEKYLSNLKLILSGEVPFEELDVVDSVLNSTEVVGKNLATKIALQNHTDITSAEKTAQAFEGGYNAYFSAQGEARVKVELDSKFGSGYYNQATYNALLKSRGAKVGRLLLDAHTTRLDASNTYLAQSGGEKTYNDIIKDTRETTIKGKISSYLGSVTGLTSDDEIAQSAEDLFDSATELNRFNSTGN